jgi:hypothetical protein
MLVGGLGQVAQVGHRQLPQAVPAGGEGCHLQQPEADHVAPVGETLESTPLHQPAREPVRRAARLV